MADLSEDEDCELRPVPLPVDVTDAEQFPNIAAAIREFHERSKP